MINSPFSDEATVTTMQPTAELLSPDFLVRSRKEILRLLNGAMSAGAQLSIGFLHTEDVESTTIVHVDEPSNMLLLECSSEWRSVIEQGGADSVMLESVFNHAKIQFQATAGTLVDLDGTDVVGLEIPDFLWCFQRRRDVRHKAHGLTITLNLGFIECDAEVTDLSVGGIGMFNCNADLQLDDGEVLHNCAIALPGVGAIQVDLTVQNQTPMQTADGRAAMRVGCQFAGLNDSARQLITHYLESLVMV